MIRRLLTFAIIAGALLIVPNYALAETEPPAAVTQEHLPNIYSASIGGVFMETDGGGETLTQYGPLESHPNIDLGLLYHFPWDGIASLSAAYGGSSVYDFSAGFRYRASLYFNVDATRYPRNMEHGVLPPSTASFNPEDLNPGYDYKIDLSRTEASLKYSVPLYPAHVRLSAQRYSVYGHRQQTFVDQNCITECHVLSQKRKVDNSHDEIKAAVDGHLGVVDAAYSFTYSRFTDNENDPSWKYGILFGYRNPGMMTHNTYPNSTANDHSFTLSTNNSGKLAAALGVGLGWRENTDVDLRRSYDAESGYVTYRPLPQVALALRYRRRHVENESPDAPAAALRQTGGYPLTPGFTEQCFSGTLSVYPVRGLSLKGDGSYKKVDRHEGGGFYLPDETTTNTWKISAVIDPLDLFKVRLYYRDERTEDPAYNNMSTDRKDAFIGIDLQPWDWILLTASYLNTRAENDDAAIWGGDGEYDADREEKQENLQTMAVFSFWQPLTVSLAYTLFKNDVSEDLLLGTPGSFKVIEPNSDYEVEGEQILFQVAWKPVTIVEVKGEFGYVRGDGYYLSRAFPFHDIGDYIRFSAIERDFVLGVGIRFSPMVRLDLNGAYRTYDEIKGEGDDEIVRSLGAQISLNW